MTHILVLSQMRGLAISESEDMESLMEEIRKRAYEIWEYHRDTGTHLICNQYGQLRERTTLDDWLEAEDEIIRSRRNDWR